MQNIIQGKNTFASKIFLLSAIAVGVLFIWQGNKGFNLADEGYLWYGAQRVMIGEVPIRDFYSYDPGRYYWSAALMMLEGNNGIIALRVAVAFFQIIGLFVALLLIARNLKSKSWLYLLLSTVIFLLWMFPRHKLFDITLSILLIEIISFLLRAPTESRYFCTGLFLGLIACFGRNHAIYGVAASLGGMFWLWMNPSSRISILKGIPLWIIGIVVGFLPMLLMVCLIPGFSTPFWEGILYLFEIKGTNIALPIPWPWMVSFSLLPCGQALRQFLIGLFFVSLLVFGVLSLLWVFFQRLRNKTVSPELVASALLVLPYAHYAYSRADIGHLALGISPFLIGILCVSGQQTVKVKWSLAFFLFLTSFWVIGGRLPSWEYRSNNHPASVEVSGSTLLMDQYVADDILLLRKLTDRYAADNKNVLLLPFWPGAYSLLGRPSPMWEIYPLLHRSQEFQHKEIERIKRSNPSLVVILDVPLDGRDELRFKNTHSLIYKYVTEYFEAIPETSRPTYLIYKAKKEAL